MTAHGARPDSVVADGAARPALAAVPSPTPTLSPAVIDRWLRRACPGPDATGPDATGPGGTVPDCTGVELEWLVVPLGHPGRRACFEDIRDQVEDLVPLPGGSKVTWEPGGQLELSGPPRPRAGGACRAMAADVAVVARSLGRAGLGLVGAGMDDRAERPRVVDSPRYRAMEAYFAREGPAGAVMMRRTAATQVNIGLGPPDGGRWHLAHALGPVLAASFANSPGPAASGSDGGGGWRSTRLGTWLDMDPTRTAPVDDAGPPGPAWARYVKAARVMGMGAPGEDMVVPERPISFEEWARCGHPLGYPTLEDLDQHCTTLFPPVRPRGWLELRMIDALPDPWWQVPVAVIDGLGRHGPAGQEAARAAAPVAGHWREAARHGLSHPGLAGAARACFGAARSALADLGEEDSLVALVEEYDERWVARARCPADDRLPGQVGAKP